MRPVQPRGPDNSLQQGSWGREDEGRKPSSPHPGTRDCRRGRAGLCGGHGCSHLARLTSPASPAEHQPAAPRSSVPADPLRSEGVGGDRENEQWGEPGQHPAKSLLPVPSHAGNIRAMCPDNPGPENHQTCCPSVLRRPSWAHSTVRSLKFRARLEPRPLCGETPATDHLAFPQSRFLHSLNTFDDQL